MHPNKTDEGLGFSLFTNYVGMFQISPFLIRPGLRRATFPPGEGISRPVGALNYNLPFETDGNILT